MIGKIKEKNILYITKTMNFGGTEKIVLELAQYFNKKFNKVIVASRGGRYEEELKGLGIKHYNIGDFDRKTLLNILKIIFKIFKVIRIEKIDLVHSHHRFSDFSCYYLSKILHFKLIVTAHLIFSDKKILSSYGNNVIAVGEDVKENLIKNYRVNEKKITVIHNGIEFKDFERNFISEKVASKTGDNRIGTIGRLSEQKGISYLIKAIPHILDQNINIKLYIVGDGEQRVYLKQLTNKLDISNYVIFTGYKEDIKEILQDLDFLVFPSLWEGFPLTILEVLSAGKPVIASSVKGITEIIKHNENGLLVKPKDIKDISDAIIWMINNPDRRKEMGKRGRRMVRSNYSLKGMFEKYEAYYNKIL